MNPAEWTWPAERLDEALRALVRAAGGALADGAASAAPLPPSPVHLTDPDHAESDPLAALNRWMEAAATVLDVEAEPVGCSYGETEDLLRRCGPALVCVPDERGELRLALLLASRRSRIHLLRPDGRARSAPVGALRGILWRSQEEALAPGIDQLLERVRLRTGRLRARRRLLHEHLADLRLQGVWILRPHPGASASPELRQIGLVRRLCGVAGTHAAAHALFLAAWYAVGRGALEGRVQFGWIGAWVLLLGTMLPLRISKLWLERSLTIDVGALLKRRLLRGALRTDPERARRVGAGSLLGRVMESEAVETLLTSSGFLAIAALVELALAAWVLGRFHGSGVALPMFAAWCAFGVLLAWHHLRRSRPWTEARMELTNELVERMVGHRTRLAQERPSRWYAGEDELLEDYLSRSRRLDAASVAAGSALPGTWMLLGTLGLAPFLLAGDAGRGSLAVGLGGLLLAHGALGKWGGSLVQLAQLRVAWEQIRGLYRAAAEREPSGVALVESRSRGSASGRTTLAMRGVRFAYGDRTRAVLEDCSFELEEGQRVLVEGPSGGGKSTLVALMLGQARPSSGLVLLHGLDRDTWGSAAWRRAVTAAPQYHANHVFSGTLAFNLLLGAHWPARPADLARARRVCEDLGLGPLIQRMPAGLLQTVGETGWQLSHGERSRVFAARALLQGCDVTVFDESLAALDPETTRVTLEAARRHARTLVVVAHP